MTCPNSGLRAIHRHELLPDTDYSQPPTSNENGRQRQVYHELPPSSNTAMFRSCYFYKHTSTSSDLTKQGDSNMGCISRAAVPRQ